MNRISIDINQLIQNTPRAFLTRLRASRMLDKPTYEQWKEIYHHFGIYHDITEDFKNPPPNYFRATIYWSSLEETKRNLKENYEAIESRYDKHDIFIPIRYFEKLLDESLSHKEFSFVKLSELCYQNNIKWDLKLLRKFKKIITEFREHEYLSVNLNTNIQLDFEMVEEFKNEICWDDIIQFKELQWDKDKIIRYKEYIVFENNDGNWAPRKGSFSLLLKTRWNFEIINALSNYWNWNELCLNENISWDIDLIKVFHSKVNFDCLSLNSKIKWTLELIEAFEEQWNWENLSGNPSLPWSLNLFKKYENKWQWTVKYDWYSGTGGGQENENNYYPSISTNPGIVWNVKMIEFAKSKIDFWRLARRGNLSLAVVKKIRKELYRKEHTGWVFHKSSDFEHTEKIYLTGWENLSKNELFKLSPDSIDFLFKNKITLTYSNGNLARDEGKYITSEFRLIEIFKNSKFASSEFVEFIITSDKYRDFFINDDFINDEIWEKIIVPYTLKNTKDLLKSFNEVIFEIPRV